MMECKRGGGFVPSPLFGGAGARNFVSDLTGSLTGKTNGSGLFRGCVPGRRACRRVAIDQSRLGPEGPVFAVLCVLPVVSAAAGRPQPLNAWPPAQARFFWLRFFLRTTSGRPWGVLLFGGCYNFIRTRRFTIGPARSGGPPFQKPNNSFHQNPIILAGQPCRAENVSRHFQKSKFSKLSSPRTRD